MKKLTVDDYRAAAANGFAEFLKTIPDGQIYKYIKAFEDDYRCHPLLKPQDSAVHFNCANCRKAHNGICVDDEMATFRIAGDTIYGTMCEDKKKDPEWEDYVRDHTGLKDAKIVELTEEEYMYVFSGMFLCETLFQNYYGKGFDHAMKGNLVIFDKAEIEQRLMTYRLAKNKKKLLS